MKVLIGIDYPYDTHPQPLTFFFFKKMSNEGQGKQIVKWKINGMEVQLGQEMQSEIKV